MGIHLADPSAAFFAHRPLASERREFWKMEELKNENNEELENEEQIEERYSLKKTMTQNIGDDVIQIVNYPIDAYYNKDNFCDYKP